MSIPALPAYLIVAFAARACRKGGTIIDQRVHDLAEHLARVASPDGYRPDRCPRCGSFLHSHGPRWRGLRDEPDAPGTDIRRYLCTGCEAVWQVLPSFIARYLHRTWAAVQSHLVAADALGRTGVEWRVTPKPSTLRRWCKRLSASAEALRTAMAGSSEKLALALERVGTQCTRGELVEGLARTGLVQRQRKLEEVAWLTLRFTSVRLM